MEACEFKVGDRVVVLDDRYKRKTIGLHGTVRAVSHDRMWSIAVELDGKENTRSTYGHFYYLVSQLKKEDSEMSKAKMDGKYRIARVGFIDYSGGATIECACYDDSVEVNDKVLVKTASHGFSAAAVISFVEDNGQDLYREIVCKLSFDAYEERLERRIRKAELMQQMAKRAEKLKELTLFETLAKADPAMAELLRNYKNL